MNLEQMTVGPLPVIAAGAGAPLLYLSGLLPVAGVDSPLANRTAEYSVRPLSDVRTVVYANRRMGLPRGMTIAEIAGEHEETISALDCGPVDVLGVSTGGSIAQQLAADHPGSVRRLVLVSTGCRLSAKTRRIQARVAQHIRAGHREQALASMIAGVLIPHGEPLAGLLSPFLTRLGRKLGDLGDLATTIEAEDSFDLASCEGTIQAPTLILAGARDRFYPQPLLQETQRLIPGSVLHVIPRRGHMTVMTGSRWSSIVRATSSRGVDRSVLTRRVTPAAHRRQWQPRAAHDQAHSSQSACSSVASRQPPNTRICRRGRAGPSTPNGARIGEDALLPPTPDGSLGGARCLI